MPQPFRISMSPVQSFRLSEIIHSVRLIVNLAGWRLPISGQKVAFGEVTPPKWRTPGQCTLTPFFILNAASQRYRAGPGKAPHRAGGHQQLRLQFPPLPIRQSSPRLARHLAQGAVGPTRVCYPSESRVAVCVAQHSHWQRLTLE
jgi:hypothetical protein